MPTSPDHLPNNLTVAKIRTGNSNIRNPILVSYIAKGLLPYRGIGSGIKRALDNWPAIDFADDREGCLFTATIHRKAGESVEKSAEKPKNTSEKILALLRNDPEFAAREMAEELVNHGEQALVSVGQTDRAELRSAERWRNGHTDPAPSR